MKVTALSCPKCQAPLSGGDHFCAHCGSAVIYDDESPKMKYTYQQVDDARIREADVQEKIRLKELEIELVKLQNETRQKKVAIWTKVIILLGLLILLAVMLLNAFNDSPIAFLLSIPMMILIAIVTFSMFK